MGNPRSPQRWHQARVLALTVFAATSSQALIPDFTVSNNAGLTITGGGGARTVGTNGITFRISPKAGSGVIMTDQPNGLKVVAQGALTGIMRPGKGKKAAPELESARTDSPLVITKSVATGTSIASGNSGTVKRTDLGYDAELIGKVALTSNTTSAGRDVRAESDRGEISFDEKSKATGLEAIISAVLTGNVKLDVKLASIPNIQEAGTYNATGSRLVIGPRGATRTLTLTGNLKISGAGGDQSGTVTGATKLILTINSKNEVIGEEIIGDEATGAPISTTIPIKKKGGGQA